MAVTLVPANMDRRSIFIRTATVHRLVGGFMIYLTQYVPEDWKQSENVDDQHYFTVSVINIQTPWPCNCYDNELITIKAMVG